jgi:membrane-bound serine protease (ClpP class)
MTTLGVCLLVIGAIAIMAEAHVPTLGVLGGPGAVALTVGTVLAVAGLGGGLAIGVLSALVVASASAGLVLVSVRKGSAVRRRAVRSGAEGLIGRVGEVRSWHNLSGKVLVDGSLWGARRGWGEDDERELQPGDAIVVERLHGLTLSVRRAEEWELAP